MRAEIVFVLSVVAVVAVGVASFIGSEYGHPLTALGRSKWARTQRIRARKAELIARGFDDYSAKNKAENEVREEAWKTTKMLQDAGVEP